MRDHTWIPLSFSQQYPTLLELQVGSPFPSRELLAVWRRSPCISPWCFPVSWLELERSPHALACPCCFLRTTCLHAIQEMASEWLETTRSQIKYLHLENISGWLQVEVAISPVAQWRRGGDAYRMWLALFNFCLCYRKLGKDRDKPIFPLPFTWWSKEISELCQRTKYAGGVSQSPTCGT